MFASCFQSSLRFTPFTLLKVESTKSFRWEFSGIFHKTSKHFFMAAAEELNYMVNAAFEHNSSLEIYWQKITP